MEEERARPYDWCRGQMICDSIESDGYTDGGYPYTEEEMDKIHLDHYRYLKSFNGVYKPELNGESFRVLLVVGRITDDPTFMIQCGNQQFEAYAEEVLIP